MRKIGVIGAGQLGQMLGFAGRQLELECIFLDPSGDSPAAACGSVLQYAFDDQAGLRQLAAQCDVVTYEFENIPVAAVAALAESVSVYPSPPALEHAQDRLVEKQLFGKLGIPLPKFQAVDNRDDLRTACDEIGTPIVLKTRRFGYDGKGQAIIRDKTDIGMALAALGERGLIAEQWIDFDREVSAIGARNVSGEIALYPLTENRHGEGILRVSTAPVEDSDLARLADEYLRALLNHFDYVGVMALELFVVDGGLLANEYAPRVHNSGHWTIEGAQTSQFENHLRAILDLPLGATGMRGYAGMVNVIGNMPADRSALNGANHFLHDYGKMPRPGRKLGHVTVVADKPALRDTAIERLGKLLIN
jgi:5-(carboxyamino)imidazole ribonucleotide synthase